MNSKAIEAAKKKLAELEKVMADNRIYHFDGSFWKPNLQQQRLLDAWDNQHYKTFTFSGSNQKGKTTIGLIIAICTLVGEWLWSGKKMQFPHNEPRIVTYTGQGWETHIQKVVEPDLIKLWPKCRAVETHKNNQGIQAHWVDKATKSELFIMSNNQESTAFEGDKVDLRVWDEPPKRENRVAGGRGLMARNGRELFVATNLNQAWFVREVIKARLSNGEPDTTVFNVKGSIWDNVSKCRCGEFILREISEDGKLIGECPKCGKVVDYERFGLTVEGVERYKSTLKKSEIKVRIEGGDYTQDTLVLPNFDREVHLRDRFKVPLNWIVDVSIDFHPSKKWAVLFVATDPKNYHYAVDMIHENGNPKYIAEEIVRKAQDNHYFLNSITIDPLSKGDENAHLEAQTVFKIIEKVLRAYNYKLETASKDKDNGISILNEWLMSENEIPSLFFFKDLGTVIEQIEDWMYDPDTLKPSKENDDFCEVLYRIALRAKPWKDPYKRNERLNTLPPVDMGKVAFG